MTEQQLLGAVKKLAMLTGWLPYHTHDSRRSDAGWPDLVLVSVRQRRILFVELKSRTGRLRPQQGVWLGVLRAVGMETAVWRPADWLDGSIERALKGERLPASPTAEHRDAVPGHPVGA
jgi:hypothetical protein